MAFGLMTSKVNKVCKFKKFPPGHLFFVSNVGKFQILEYRKVAVLPQGPVTMLRIWHDFFKISGWKVSGICSQSVCLIKSLIRKFDYTIKVWISVRNFFIWCLEVHFFVMSIQHCNFDWSAY